MTSNLSVVSNPTARLYASNSECSLAVGLYPYRLSGSCVLFVAHSTILLR